MLYRRGGLSHALSHGLSHGLSHRLSHDLPVPGPIVRPAREGRRRRFSEADKRQILEEAMRPDTRFSEVARRYGIAERVLFRWKQELTQVAPLFVAVAPAWRLYLHPPKERTVFKELKKSDWAVVAICLAASIFLGIYSVKLAIAYRTQNDAPRVIQRPT